MRKAARLCLSLNRRCVLRPESNLGIVLIGIALVFTAGPVFGNTSGGQAAVTHTRVEVETLVRDLGGTSPPWWDSVELTYPETLDVSWPLKADGPWNARKNIGQYIWDVINPNPGRWREGVKLVHHLMILNKDDSAKVCRSMNTLGRMFHDLLEDWPRAAFWWRMSAQRGGAYDPLGLAHCYWKMGNKSMAMEVLSQYRQDYTRHGAIIRLWAEMGEFDKAIKLADEKARFGAADVGYLAAGDVCRLRGELQRGLAYYEKVLATPTANAREKDSEHNRERAKANIEAIKCFDALDLSRIPDGLYHAGSTAYAGPLYVEVAVKSNRIESVRITEHKERQFYSAFTDTPKRIIERQSVKGIDVVSGATMTSEAIINATAKALASGMK
ncbi:MAG: FMN-binding protein [Planctomycetota bacterium]